MRIVVYGIPAPQGSKRFVGHAKSGRGIMIESSAKVKPWREAVKHAAIEAARKELEESLSAGVVRADQTIRGAVRVVMVFSLPRPKSARRGAVPSKRPDLSKLVRATEDALTEAGVWGDDAQVVDMQAYKRYTGTTAITVDGSWAILERAGAVITIEPLGVGL